MRSTAAFLAVLGAASLGLAENNNPDVVQIPTPTLRIIKTAVQIRQSFPTLVDDSNDPAKKPIYDCLSSQGSLSRSAPTQPADLAAWSRTLSATQPRLTLNPPMQAAGGPEVYCTSAWFPLKQEKVPESLSAEDASWKSAWSSWRDSVAPAAQSLASSCKTIPYAETAAGLALFMVATDVQECATAMSVVFGGTPAQATGSGTNGGGSGGAGVGGGGAAATSSSSAAGARETAGIVVGAVALMGVIGGVAVL